ncbi:MAG: hypothetical protein ACTTKD_07615 [Peptoanaerobacter stomatis]|uniref:hypothetical protein n=1 Tax=Peptoanaerobacter stomatis TaxID=796937 RepID=UPI003F9F051F
MEKLITVINQTPMRVLAQTKSELYVFEPFDTGQNVLDLTVDEINYLNKNSLLFKEGYLTVSDEDKEDVFTEIGLKNYKDIISREEIIDAIENPNTNKLQKLINITSFSVFRRVRTELVGLLSIPNDISNRVIKLIDERYDELSKNQISSDIEVGHISSSNSNTKALEEQIAMLTKKIEMLEKGNGNEDDDKKESKKSTKKNTKKSDEE